MFDLKDKIIYQKNCEIKDLKEKLHRRNMQIAELKKKVKSTDNGYPAEKLLKGLAGYLKWGVQHELSDSVSLFNISHDLFNWLKDKDEKWFSPRTAGYEKYITE